MSRVEKRAGGRLFRALTVLVSVVLLALVARALPWRDRVVWRIGEQAHAVPGVLLGDWQEPSVGFRIDAGWRPDASVPPQLHRLSGGVETRVTPDRWSAPGFELEGAFEWRPGMPRVFAGLDLRSALSALLLIASAQFMILTRWWRLLCRLGCPMSFLQALRLGLIGMFFNTVVPGSAGGDLVKTLIVVRENPGRRAEALASIVLDRFLGVVVLVGLAAVMVSFLGGDFARLRTPIFLFLTALLAGPVVWWNRTFRRWVGIDRLRERFPRLARIDDFDAALVVLAKHPGELALALALTLCNHLAMVGAILVLGRAFGDQLPASSYLVLVPVANLVSALPVAAGGWGLGEAAYGILFGLAGGNVSIGAAASATSRLGLTLLGMLGGLCLQHPSLRRSWSASDSADTGQAGMPIGEP